jgi:hypothetical protein
MTEHNDSPDDAPQTAPQSPPSQPAYGTPMPPMSPMAPMPPAAPESAAPAGPPPSQVVNASRLLLASAGLGVIGIIVLLASKSTIRHAILKKNPTYDNAKLNTVTNAAVVTDIVFAVIFIALYVWLSRQLLKAKNWARITAIVFAALGVLFGLISFANPTAAATKVLEVVTLLIDLGILVLLLQKPSAAFFGRARRR